MEICFLLHLDWSLPRWEPAAGCSSRLAGCNERGESDSTESAPPPGNGSCRWDSPSLCYSSAETTQNAGSSSSMVRSKILTVQWKPCFVAFCNDRGHRKLINFLHVLFYLWFWLGLLFLHYFKIEYIFQISSFIKFHTTKWGWLSVDPCMSLPPSSPSLTSTRLMMCRRNSWASCCRLEENSGCPLLTRALNIRGEMPLCCCWNQNLDISLTRKPPVNARHCEHKLFFEFLKKKPNPNKNY